MTGLLETDARSTAVKEASGAHTCIISLPTATTHDFGKSETVQIIIRDTKDWFHLHEVPHSRVTKQVSFLRIP